MLYFLGTQEVDISEKKKIYIYIYVYNNSLNWPKSVKLQNGGNMYIQYIVDIDLSSEDKIR